MLMLCELCLFPLKLFCSIFRYFTAYARALLTAVHIYCIGIYYVFYEFFVDCQTGLKTLRGDTLFQDKLREWRKNLAKMRVQRKNEDGEEAMMNGEDQPKFVAVITGADGTIGSEILRYLLSLDFLVFAIGSKPPSLFPNENLRFIKCDLSARNEVFEAVECVQLECDQIDVLILNAAIMLYPGFGWFPYRRDIIGQSIIERHLAINVLANAQIFASFAARMECSVLQNPAAIFVSSSTAHAGDISLLLADEERFWCRHLNGYKAYADSKLLLTAYVKYLSRVLKSKNSKISVASLHPGIVPGNLYRHVFWPFRCLINYFLAPFLRTPRQAATLILDLAFSAAQMQVGAYHENGLPARMEGTEDPDEVWQIGKAVREMIIDNDSSSFLSELNGGGGFHDETTAYESPVFSD